MVSSAFFQKKIPLNKYLMNNLETAENLTKIIMKKIYIKKKQKKLVDSLVAFKMIYCFILHLLRQNLFIFYFYH